MIEAMAAAERDGPAGAPKRPVAYWLLAVCLLLALMVVAGGATRLTDSGLSITEWRPVTGAIPPLSSKAWAEEFERYQQTPEYTLVNAGMSLQDFKAIYWWEWGHRLLGRLIGVAFLVPLLWFAWRRTLDRPLLLRLAVIFLLGGAQGALGWYMVRSGLTARVDVSQYRLAAHLGLAFIIFGLTFWTALDLLRPRERAAPRSVAPVAAGLTALVFAQVVMGAFVAGLNAGFRYNDWPLMEGRFVPETALALTPLARNLFDNPATVQFEHRMLGYLVVACILGAFAWAQRAPFSPRLRAAFTVLAAVALAQMALGVWTLMAVVPLPLGLLHQAGALALFAAAINLLHGARSRSS